MASTIVLQIDSRGFSIPDRSKPFHMAENNDKPSEALRQNPNGLFHHFPFYAKTSIINRIRAGLVGWDYKFLQLPSPKYRGPTWIKVDCLRKLLCSDEFLKYDYVIYLDSDAWIRDEYALSKLIEELAASSYHGFIGTDPIKSYNTRINTGCIILRNNQQNKNFFQAIWNAPALHYKHARYLWGSFHEQSITDDLLKQTPGFWKLLPLNSINTPWGDVVRHCWWKRSYCEKKIKSGFSFQIGSHRKRGARHDTCINKFLEDELIIVLNTVTKLLNEPLRNHAYSLLDE